jgi:type II secretory pathway component GspD/PulD (secretin)
MELRRGLSGMAGLLVTAALFALALSAPALSAQVASDNGEANGEGMSGDEGEEGEEGEEEFVPNPNDPITVDFVQKEIHTVMHYIALRSGLNVIIQGTVNVPLTVYFGNIVPREAIAQICKTNNLDMIEDAGIIIIKTRQTATRLANVLRGDHPGRFHVTFERQDLVSAISEVAKVTNTQVFVPAVPAAMAERLETPRPADPNDPEEALRSLLTPWAAGQEQQVTQIQSRLISMYMRDARPAAILARLASLGDLRMREIQLEGTEVDPENPEQTVAVVGYEFEYRLQLTGIGAEAVIPRDEEMKRGEWIIPGADMNRVKSEVRQLVSPVGKVVSDDATHLLVVFDLEENLARIGSFLDVVSLRSAERSQLLALEADDPMEAKEYRIIRDVSTPQIQQQIQSLLSEEGRAIPNPDQNSVIVYERRSRLAALDRLMSSLDTAPEQVSIMAKLIEVTLDDYVGYGLEVFTNNRADSLNRGMTTASSFDTATGTTGGMFGQPTGFNPFFATFSNPRLDIRLELLANEGRVETLSQPHQLVSNRQTARIEVGQEIPYLESTSAGAGTTTASVSFKEVAIVMEVTPTVLENGLIRLQITLTVREVIGNIAIQGNNTPVLSKRETKTDVFIHDGETLVMGGLLRERERLDENGLPLLKDIPVLGYLFKSANRTRNKTDLLFFLRPQIVTAGQRAQFSRGGLVVERDLRPLVDTPESAKGASMREGTYRLPGVTPRPRHYDEGARPSSADEVNSGAGS